MADQLNSSATSVVECEDLLTEILVRLPVKSLIRFQCVTKYWHSFISGTQFRQKHCSTHKINSSISGLYLLHKPSSSNHVVTLSGSTEGIPPSLDFLGSTDVRLQAHSNGLLLGWYNDRKFFFVCNPTTKSYSKVAIPEKIELYRELCSLAYDPCSSSVYKVVTVSREGRGCVINVYSSDNASWKKIVVHDSEFVIMNWEPGIFFKGSLYWLDNIGCIRRFHMDSEDLKVIGFPLGAHRAIKYFGEYMGSLIAIEHKYRGWGDQWFDIFEMDSSDSSQWTKKSSIKVIRTCELFNMQCTVMCVSKFASGGELELILSIPGKVVSYSRNYRRRNKKLKVLSVNPAIGPGCLPSAFNFSVYPFIETLAPV